MDAGRSLGLTDLLEEISAQVYLPDRDVDKPAMFSVDHCFSIRGQGTVLTGTLLQGKINVNDVSELTVIS